MKIRWMWEEQRCLSFSVVIDNGVIREEGSEIHKFPRNNSVPDEALAINVPTDAAAAAHTRTHKVKLPVLSWLRLAKITTTTCLVGISKTSP